MVYLPRRNLPESYERDFVEMETYGPQLYLGQHGYCGAFGKVTMLVPKKNVSELRETISPFLGRLAGLGPQQDLIDWRHGICYTCGCWQSCRPGKGRQIDR